MPHNEAILHAAPDDVFGALLEPDNFAYWVLGSKRVRNVDETWPDEGSAFHHAVGFGLLHVEDHTELVEVDPPRSLVMHAKAGMLGSAIVRLTLEPNGQGTRVVMDEEPHTGLATVLPVRLFELLTGARIAGSIQRLKRLIEEPGTAEELAEHRSILGRAGRPVPVALAAVAIGGAVVVAIRRVARGRGG